MEFECNAWGIARPDIICIEGNGIRPSHKGDGYRIGGAMYTLNSTEVHCVCYVALEHHPNDSRLRIAEDDICQTLNQRMGTGGGNVPLVLEIRNEKKSKNK